MPHIKTLGVSLMFGLLLQACALPTHYAYKKESAMPEAIPLSPRLPGAPEGSYYTNPSKPMTPPPTAAPVVWRPGEPCPKDGYYKAVSDDQEENAYRQKQPPSPERAGSAFDTNMAFNAKALAKLRMVWVAELDEYGRNYSTKRKEPPKLW